MPPILPVGLSSGVLLPGSLPNAVSLCTKVRSDLLCTNNTQWHCSYLSQAETVGGTVFCVTGLAQFLAYIIAIFIEVAVKPNFMLSPQLLLCRATASKSLSILCLGRSCQALSLAHCK